MAGPFEKMLGKVQRYLFGSGTDDSELEGDNYVTETTREREKQPRLKSNETSRVKMVHHYPKQGDKYKQGNHREKAKRREEERISTYQETKERKKINEKQLEDTKGEKNKSAATIHKNVPEHWGKPKEKQAFFQGNNFEAKDVPSPVFGFKKFPWRSETLRKTTEMILREPVRDVTLLREEEHREQELAVTASLTEAAPAVSDYEHEEEEIEEIQDLYDSEEEEQREETPAIADNKEVHTEAHGEEPQEPEVEAPVLQDHSSNEEKLNRRERRRLEAERKKKEKKSAEMQKHEVPFNVLMYPGSRPKKREDTKQPSSQDYEFPTLSLLNIPPKVENEDNVSLNEQREQLEATLHNFNVKAKVVQVTKGPAVTRFEVQPEPGVKVNKITNLTDDIKLALAAKDLRMEAPIPGKSAIGIEVPNVTSKPVFLREILRRDVFTRSHSPLTVAMGLDISGNPVVSDLQKMPHGLIAGATGSGKSVCINSILLSLLYKARPDELKLMLIDPKMVELASYKDIPHLVTPVINDAKQATAGLKWAVEEMEERYQKLAHEGVRDIKKYNERMVNNREYAKKMPYLVIIIDELADLMMVAPQDVEDAVCRIAQKARACGIHLLLATQRPSVDVITGLIKANIPSRTAFAVSSQADSRTILDTGGAERLIGKGDMLFYESGSSKPIRVQGTFVSDEEIEAVTEFTKNQQKPAYLFDQEELKKKADYQENMDELFEEACQFVADQGSASSSLLQRRFSIGYNRAAKLIDTMEERGIISEAMGSKPRRVLMTSREIEENITM